MSKPYRHLYFDLDHTLWDFEKNSDLALRTLHGEFGLAEHGVNDVDAFIRKYKEVNALCWKLYREGKMEKAELRYRRFQEAFAIFGVNDQELASRFGDGYVDLSPTLTALVDGTQEVLQYLNGRYDLHIITNGFKEIQFTKLSRSGIAEHFRKVIVSEDVGVRKPHPKVFHYALDRAGAHKGESLMIGDDLEADVLGAKNAGLHQVYYNPEKTPHSEDIAYEISHLRELMDIL